MRAAESKPDVLQEGRFARLQAIEWWNQELLSASKVLVVGAGALGNEVIKNLALLGIGQLAIADMDRIELSNLSRSVLFREKDENQPKAERAAAAAQAIYPALRVYPLVGNVLAELGLGWFHWADIVVGALDNREARVFVNGACARVGRPWLDGGIEVLHGIVRGFAPPATACYECTMSQVDWDLLNKRRSCSLLARRALTQGGTPTTPTTASVIGAIQAQEVVKLLHGMEALVGRGFVYDGTNHSSYGVNYPIDPNCGWHEAAATIVTDKHWTSDTPLRLLMETAEKRLGGVDAVDLGREIVSTLECVQCQQKQEVMLPAEKVSADQLLCPQCHREASPSFLHSIGPESELLARTPRQLGLPSWDIVWARRGEQSVGLELAGDAPASAVGKGATGALPE